MRKLMIILGAIAIVASACGGDDDDGGVAAADSPLVSAIADEIVDGSDPDSPVGTRQEAECWAGRIVGGIGESRLAELGVSVNDVGELDEYDFSDGEIDTIVDSLGDCVDLRALMAQEMVGDLGEDAANCVADAFDDGFLSDLMKASFRGEEPGGDEFFQTMLDIAAECDLPLG
ncbi:MAG: hypothetical protein AAF480_02100 [Actinomycetota bacterium]